MTTTAIAARQWSQQQQQIFDMFRRGPSTGHFIVRARAGCGKTTTIIEGVNHAPERKILLAAFNKSIATELQARTTSAAVVAKTLHGVGFSIVRRYWEGVAIAQKSERADSLTDKVCGGRTPDAIKSLVSTLHTKGREIAPHARVIADIRDIAMTFECEPDAKWSEDGFDLDFVCARALEAMALAADVKPVGIGIDFADMIFLPIRNRWINPQFDLVVIDEAQDMTSAQLEIARGVCRGRVVIVGDDRQAIYGFRGADSGSIDRLKSELKATELALTVTYRCAKSIVEIAAAIVPDFEAGPKNPTGEVRAIVLAKLMDAAQPGDFVLSRKNAPLAQVAMSMIRAQKRVRIAGRDIGAGLKAIVRKLSKGAAKSSIPALLEKLVVWQEREVTRAIAAGRDERAELVKDQADTIAVLSEGVASVHELDARVDALFTDNGLGDAGVIVCSSVHKSKGLEADRVFVLRDTLYPERKGKTPTPAQQREEENIEYVAVTRAKSVLTWVTER